MPTFWDKPTKTWLKSPDAFFFLFTPYQKKKKKKKAAGWRDYHQLTYARSANPKNCSKSTRPFSSLEWVGSGYETIYHWDPVFSPNPMRPHPLLSCDCYHDELTSTFDPTMRFKRSNSNLVMTFLELLLFLCC